ncbi:MAG: VOC family protein [Melioribacteraceae bacterium]|nr:VOC family protein [Melioribacteraceae bacterium]
MPLIKVRKLHTILLVNDLQKSKAFYKLLFNLNPVVDTENIVEFEIGTNLILGLQTIDLPSKIFDYDVFAKYPNTSAGIHEIYIECENAEEMHEKAKQYGCIELSPFQKREWGHYTGYSINHDGHILAFAWIAE